MPATAAVPSERVQRSRLAICEACLDLIQAGVLQPSADQVAERAGLSRRSIFNHFGDLAELYDACVDLAVVRHAPLLEPIPPELPLGERIPRVASVLGRFLEATAPFARALTVQALAGDDRRTEALRVGREGLDHQREALERVFAPELDRLSAAERADTLDALAIAGSPAAWSYAREQRRRSPDAASALMERQIRAILREAGA